MAIPEDAITSLTQTSTAPPPPNKTNHDDLTAAANNNNNKNTTSSQSPTSITINLTSLQPNTPLGMKLAPLHNTTVVTGWERLPNRHAQSGGTGGSNKKLGIIQKSGKVRLGDVLTKINGVSVEKMTFRQIMDLLRKTKEEGGLETLTFDAPRSATNGNNPTVGGTGGNNGEDADRRTKTNLRRFLFDSRIPRARIRNEEVSSGEDDEGGLTIPASQQSVVGNDNNNNNSSSNKRKTTSFIEYEIVCHLVLRGGRRSDLALDDEEFHWSVWKRFSEFKTLDGNLREAYPWQMDAMETQFPSTRPLSSLFSPLSPSFVETRRNELDEYWQHVLQIEEMTDFANPHRYSTDLLRFLSMDKYILLSGAASSSSDPNDVVNDDDDDDNVYNVDGKTKNKRSTSRIIFMKQVVRSNPINPARAAIKTRLPGIYTVRVMMPGGGGGEVTMCNERDEWLRCGNNNYAMRLN